MSGVEIWQRTASEGQMGCRRGQEGWPLPLYKGLAGALYLVHETKVYTAENKVIIKMIIFVPRDILWVIIGIISSRQFPLRVPTRYILVQGNNNK